MKKNSSQKNNEKIFGTELLFYFNSYVKRIIQWVRAGDPPPNSQKKMLYLIIFLFFFGIGTTTMWILSYMGIILNLQSPNYLLVISFMTLCPSLYGMVVSYCCWRRYHGYDWWIIPNFD